MKKTLYIILLLTFSIGFAQSPSNNHQDLSGEEQRISNIKHQLELLSVENSGLTENVETEISVNNITLANFLLAISNVHKVNINVSPELSQITIANNFTNVTVADLLVFLCKEYHLTIDFTGNILSIKMYQEPPREIVKKMIPITFNASRNTISLDLKEDILYDVFKTIMDETGKNLLFATGLDQKRITAYIQNVPFDAAMDKLALANDLYVEKSKDGFYVFESNTIPDTETNSTSVNRPKRIRNSSIYFKVLNPDTKLLDVDFISAPISDIINDIGDELNIDIFTATPLEKAGLATFKAKAISFDKLLLRIFESKQKASDNVKTQTPNSNNRNVKLEADSSEEIFSFKKEDSIYFFGTEDQLSIRTVEVVYLQHRSIELLSDPSVGNNINSTSSRVLNNLSGINDNYNNQYGNGNSQGYNRPSVSNNSNGRDANDAEHKSLLSVFPDDIISSLDIKVDYELNSFYVNGSAAMVERFKSFVKKIDKPVPVILIEVMIIEVKKSATIEAGVTWGIGDAPVTTQGGIFPETNLTLGAKTVNKVLGSFNSFAGFNLGKVGPNFFATIKDMETNGDLKIKSTPRLATANNHRATLSNGQTSFYAVTRRNIYGTDNPQTSEITNYLPIDAELGLSIKPSVSGDGQVLLDISITQSSFGQRIAEDAPPDVISRNFSSIIRMHDQDLAILGGLEVQMKNNSGSGVPLLARVPVIKWLFSKRKREVSKSKLTILIKPTVIY